jgi:hypothetical protein
MRMKFFCIVLAGLLAGACNQADAARANSLAAPAPAGGDAAATPVSTAGTATPAWREITIPSGTLLPVTLDTPVGSDTSRVEEPVTAHLARPVHVHGQAVLPEGTRVSGVVTDATRSAKVKGRAHVALRFDSMTPRGEDQRYAIQTAAVGRTAPGTKKKDALEIGAPAAGGAIIGALIGGGKGAAIGAGVGGGAGTAVVLSTRGKEVHLAKGAQLTLKLAAPVTIRVRG